MPVKVLTLWSPWAQLVALGVKGHETRSWPTSHRGPVLVHAAKAWNQVIGEFWGKYGAMLPPGVRLPDDPSLGCVVALAEVADCLPTTAARPTDALDMTFGDWSPGRYAFRLAGVRPLPHPVPWRGGQRLRNAPPGLVESVYGQLGLELPPEPELPLFAVAGGACGQ